MKLSQNQKIALAVVALGLLVWAVKMSDRREDMMNGGGGGGSKRTETTAASGTYTCAEGKSFTLTVQADGTARVTGASSNGVVLHKSNAAAIWISSDAKVAVREIAGYTILIEGDKTTRDRCTLKK